MSQRTINCLIDPATLVLVPCVTPGPNVTLAIIETVLTGNGVTGTLSYAGQVRAFLTFDPTGTQIIGWTLTANDYSTQQSVANIIAAL